MLQDSYTEEDSATLKDDCHNQAKPQNNPTGCTAARCEDSVLGESSTKGGKGDHKRIPTTDNLAGYMRQRVIVKAAKGGE